eukprot:jgi/Astpho2/5535/Aster-x1299
MAFVNRAHRVTLLGTPSATGIEVGPGSYSVPAAGTRQYPNYAPFSSTAERDLSGEPSTSKFSPGPGSHNLGAAVPGSRTSFSQSSPAFANREPRLFTPRYEQAADGRLVPQSPPVPILSGEKDSRVGVGHYELASALAATRACPRAAAFGKAKARGVEAWPVAAPGPGAYDATVPSKPASRRVNVAAPTPLSAIASLRARLQSHRGSGLEQDARDIDELIRSTLRGQQRWEPKASASSSAPQPPGPGYYGNLPGAFDRVTKRRRSGRKAAFGSTAQRAQPVDLQSAGSQPGPGSYSVGAKATTWLEREVTDAPAPFSTTVERFRRSRQSSDLGPGSYNTEHLSLKEGLAQRRVNAAKHGGFGVGARWRPRSTARAETAPGPGSYSRMNAPRRPDEENASPAFLQKQDRFGDHLDQFRRPQKAHVRDLLVAEVTTGEAPLNNRQQAQLVGPGAYKLPDAWAQKHARAYTAYAQPMVSGSARFLEEHDKAYVPGPGAYSGAAADLQRVFKPYVRSSAGFATTSGRYSAAASKKDIPGPGTYDLAKALLKQTFNVTYDQQIDFV